MEYNFDDIRPYNDSEVKDKIGLLIKDPVFDEVMMFMFKLRQKVDNLKAQLGMINTIEQLQHSFISGQVEWVVNNTSDGLTCSGLEMLDKNKAYLFISNHRDIILDAALLNLLLYKNGIKTARIAIGNNLLLYKWIEIIVKLNRSFIIKRNLAPRELLEASKKVSYFIRKSILEDNLSVWIAQREGRTKDGFDKTQISVLKMLNMSNDNDMAQGFKELNLIPVSISYEIEPCGLAKIKELIKQEKYGLVKTSKDDLKSMSMGIFNPKGQMNFAFGNPVAISYEKILSKEEGNNHLKRLAGLIDDQIYANYKLWPNNYIAYDMLTGGHRFRDRYNHKTKKHFKLMVEQAMVNIDYPVSDIKERFLMVYANPVYNKLKTINDC